MQIKGGTSDNKYIFEVEPTTLEDYEFVKLGIDAEDNPMIVIKNEFKLKYEKKVLVSSIITTFYLEMLGLRWFKHKNSLNCVF